MAPQKLSEVPIKKPLGKKPLTQFKGFQSPVIQGADKNKAKEKLQMDLDELIKKSNAQKLTGMLAGIKKDEDKHLFESLESFRPSDQKQDEAMDEPATEE